jgi:hypothetical protein
MRWPPYERPDLSGITFNVLRSHANVKRFGACSTTSHVAGRAPEYPYDAIRAV